MQLFSSALNRWALLLPMAACLALLLDSQARDMRLLAAVGLIVLAQIREIMFLHDLSESQAEAKTKHPSPASAPIEASEHAQIPTQASRPVLTPTHTPKPASTPLAITVQNKRI